MQPTNYIASPIPPINAAIPQLTTTNIKVIRRFCFLFIPFSLKNSSSTVSLEGKTQRGAAAIIENNKAKQPTLIQDKSLSRSAYKIFLRHNSDSNPINDKYPKIPTIV